MTQPINTFQDILNALEQEPELRKQLRRHILTEDLLNLPAVVGLLDEGEEPVTSQLRSLHASVQDLQGSVQDLQGSVQDLQGSVQDLQGSVGPLEEGEEPLTSQLRSLNARLEPAENRMRRVDSRTGEQEGRHYERKIAGWAPRLLYEAIGMRSAKVIYRSMDRYGEEEFHALLDEKDRRPLNLQEFLDLDAIDFVAEGLMTSNEGTDQLTYVAAEASITGEAKDVRRADRRSRLLSQARGVPCLPVVIAEHLDQRLQAALLDDKAAFPSVSAAKFNDGRAEETPGEELRQDVLAIVTGSEE